MPTITDRNQKSRYRTPKQERNEPRDDLDRELQALAVNQEVEKFLDRYPNEQNFQKEVAAALAKRVLSFSAEGSE
jgi:hypothetical protein